MSPGPAVAPVTVYQPPSRLPFPPVKALWASRELTWFLALRDIRVRYRQAALGLLWVVLQPVLTMILFTLFFRAVAQVEADAPSYALFAFAGLVPWYFFANAVSRCSESVVANSALVSKANFPRLHLPISALLTAAVDLAVALAVLLAVAAAVGSSPSLRWFLLVPLAALAATAALGIGLWLAALNARYRDVRQAVPFLLQAGLFASPLAYPASLVPTQWASLYGLNPMAAVIEGFRAVLVGGPTTTVSLLLPGAVVAIVLCVSGLLWFERSVQWLADEV